MSEVEEPYTRLRKGMRINNHAKKYQYGNIEIDMFTMSQLAQKLERTKLTLMGWEHQGLLPRTAFISGNGTRLYPRKLVERLYRQFVKWHSEGTFHWTEEVKVKIRELFEEEPEPLLELLKANKEGK